LSINYCILHTAFKIVPGKKNLLSSCNLLTIARKTSYWV